MSRHGSHRHPKPERRQQSAVVQRRTSGLEAEAGGSTSAMEMQEIERPEQYSRAEASGCCVVLVCSDCAARGVSIRPAPRFLAPGTKYPAAGPRLTTQG